MEPVFDNNLLALIAAYGDLQEEPPSEDRTRQFGRLVVDLLRSSGVDAALRLQDAPVVAFRHDGQHYLMGLTWAERPMDGSAAAELVRSMRATADDGTVMVLSMSGFTPSTADRVVGSDSSRTLLWDRTHFEAAVCGVATVPDLLAIGSRSVFLEGVPYVSVAAMLVGADEAACPRMATPDLLPAPWPVLKEPYEGIPAQLVLVGEDGWDQPSGIAALDVDRLVVVTAGGLVELDTARGVTSWIIRLAGCTNEPLVMPDGSVLAVCNNAVVRVTNGRLEAVAGGFSGGVHVLAGPDGEPWVLSGIGPTFGTGQGTLALTRIGDRVGRQHRHDIHFDADIHTAGWLEQRRFFLAAAGHSTVIDLNRSSRVDKDDWIVSPQGYRAHLLAIDRHRVVIAAGNSTGVGVTLFRTDVLTRSSQLLADLNVNSVHGLCAAPDGTGYVLGDVYGARRGPRDPWPVLIRLPGLRPPAVAQPPVPAVAAAVPRQIEVAGPPATPAAATVEPGDLVGSAVLADPYDAVRLAARGNRRDYALDPRPIDDGGQAEVFRARHKPSGMFVAFKRLRSTGADAVARMKREIDVARALGANPHVMPVLDHSDKYEWFAMPLAQDTAATTLAEFGQPLALRELVTAICGALHPAHTLGWIHRDLKPANLLRRDGVWTVGDWGYGRRPRGQTTNPDRTRVGAMLGTEGFAAPELSIDAHQAGPQSDVYSIGQIIGWALRGTWPQANTPLLPASGPWRQVVKAATQADPARRPATVDDLLELIRQELDHDQPDDSDPAAQFLAAANQGDVGAAARLFVLAVRRPADLDLYSEVLARLGLEAVHAAVASDVPRTVDVVLAMKDHLRGANQLSFEDADRIITWLHWIEMWAAEAADLDLLQEAAEAVLAWDAHWDQWTPQRQIRAWMATLTGDPAAVVAGALRNNRDAARHFEELSENRRVDGRIRRAVRGAPTSVSGAAQPQPPTTDPLGPV